MSNAWHKRWNDLTIHVSFCHDNHSDRDGREPMELWGTRDQLSLAASHFTLVCSSSMYYSSLGLVDKQHWLFWESLLGHFASCLSSEAVSGPRACKNARSSPVAHGISFIFWKPKTQNSVSFLLQGSMINFIICANESFMGFLFVGVFFVGTTRAASFVSLGWSLPWCSSSSSRRIFCHSSSTHVGNEVFLYWEASKMASACGISDSSARTWFWICIC